MANNLIGSFDSHEIENKSNKINVKQQKRGQTKIKMQTLSTGAMLVMVSSVRLPFESFLASPSSRVSCFCRSNIYSAYNTH